MAVVSFLGNQLGSQIAVPLVSNIVCESIGWRMTYRTLAVSAGALGGAAVCLSKERSDGQTLGDKDGNQREQEEEEQQDNEIEIEVDFAKADAVETTWTRTMVLCCPTFWVHAFLTFTAFLMEMGWVYEVREVVAEMASDWDPTAAVNNVLVLRGVAGGVGTVAGGFLYDRCGGRVCACLGQSLQAFSMLLLRWQHPFVLWLVCIWNSWIALIGASYT